MNNGNLTSTIIKTSSCNFSNVNDFNNNDNNGNVVKSTVSDY